MKIVWMVSIGTPISVGVMSLTGDKWAAWAFSVAVIFAVALFPDRTRPS